MRNKITILLLVLILLLFPKGVSAVAQLEKVDTSNAIFATAQSNFGIYQHEIATGDLNDDGYTDIVVGNQTYNSNAGRVVIFWGGPNYTLNDLAASTNYTLFQVDYALGNQKPFFGRSVIIKDVNKDGIDDLLVSSPFYGYDGTNINTLKGALYIFFGGNKLVSMQDPDVLLIAENSNSINFIPSIYDINNDGNEDFITGGSFFNNFDGRVNIFLGPLASTNAPSFTIPALSTGNRFGLDVFPGDFNGDGKADLISSVYNNHLTPEISRDHASFVYLGDDLSNGYDLVISTCPSDVGYYLDIGFVFDFNKDGFDDFFHTSEFCNAGLGTYQGMLSIYKGGETFDNISDQDFIGTAANDYFGRQINSIGDLNNDGYEEVAIGAFGYPNNLKNGRIQILKGGPEIPSTFEWEIVGESAGDRETVFIPGNDFNKNGYPDFITLAYGYPAGGNLARFALYELEHGEVTFDVPESKVYDKTNQILSGEVNNDSINLKSVQISVDKITWIDCVADDGAFDSLNEQFTCDYSALGLPNGSYIFYMRASDENDVFTPEAFFAQINITPNSSLSQTGSKLDLYFFVPTVIFLMSIVGFFFKKFKFASQYS